MMRKMNWKLVLYIGLLGLFAFFLISYAIDKATTNLFGIGMLMFVLLLGAVLAFRVVAGTFVLDKTNTLPFLIAIVIMGGLIYLLFVVGVLPGALRNFYSIAQINADSQYIFSIFG
jgi:hypothetical protein